MLNKTASILDVSNMLSIAQRRCDDFNVALEYDERAETAMSNGQTITLPAVGIEPTHPCGKRFTVFRN